MEISSATQWSTASGIGGNSGDIPAAAGQGALSELFGTEEEAVDSSFLALWQSLVSGVHVSPAGSNPPIDTPPVRERPETPTSLPRIPESAVSQLRGSDGAVAQAPPAAGLAETAPSTFGVPADPQARPTGETGGIPDLDVDAPIFETVTLAATSAVEASPTGLDSSPTFANRPSAVVDSIVAAVSEVPPFGDSDLLREPGTSGTDEIPSVATSSIVEGDVTTSTVDETSLANPAHRIDQRDATSVSARETPDLLIVEPSVWDRPVTVSERLSQSSIASALPTSNGVGPAQVNLQDQRLPNQNRSETSRTKTPSQTIPPVSTLAAGMPVFEGAANVTVEGTPPLADSPWSIDVVSSPDSDVRSFTPGPVTEKSAFNHEQPTFDIESASDRKWSYTAPLRDVSAFAAELRGLSESDREIDSILSSYAEGRPDAVSRPDLSFPPTSASVLGSGDIPRPVVPANRSAISTFAVDQVISHVTSRNAEGASRVEAQIDPPELGRMWIEMTRTSEGVTAHLTVEDPAVWNLLDQQMRDVRDNLQTAGIPMTSFTLSMGTDGRGTREDARQDESASAPRRIAARRPPPRTPSVHREIDTTA